MIYSFVKRVLNLLKNNDILHDFSENDIKKIQQPAGRRTHSSHSEPDKIPDKISSGNEQKSIDRF